MAGSACFLLAELLRWSTFGEIKAAVTICLKKCNEDIYGTSDSDSLAGTEYDILKLDPGYCEGAYCAAKIYHAMGTEDVRYPVAMEIKKKPLKTFPVIHMSMNTMKVLVSMSGSSGMNGSNISLTLLR